MTERRPHRRARSERLLAAVHQYGFSPGSSPLGAVPRHAAKAAFLSAMVLRDAPRARGPALARYWNWQVRRRLYGETVTVVFDRGYSLSIPPWSEIGGMIVALGSHEPRETRLIDRLLRPGDRFVDVGANIGFYTHRAAALGADVLAFEPGAGARTAMAASLVRAGLSDRVTVVACALADYEGKAFLTDGDVSRHLSTEGPSTSAVDVRRLDGVAGEHNLASLRTPAITVLKIDAEGHDLAVLRGAAQFLDQVRPVVMVETWPGDDQVRLLLGGYGYRLFRVANDGSLLRLPEDHFEQANLVAIPAGDTGLVAERRLDEASGPRLRPPRVTAWR